MADEPTNVLGFPTDGPIDGPTPGGAPWSWVPDHWQQPDTVPLQPGLGIPAASLDTAAGSAPSTDIEMPTDYVGAGASPEIEMPADYAGPGADPYAPQALPMPGQSGPVTQPGQLETPPGVTGPITAPGQLGFVPPVVPGSAPVYPWTNVAPSGPVTQPGQLPDAAATPVAPTAEQKAAAQKAAEPYLYADDPSKDPDQKRGQEFLNDLADNHPLAFADYIGKKNAESVIRGATANLKLATDERDQIKANYDAKVAADAYAQQRADQTWNDATALASQKIDNGRWWRNLSTGQKIGGWISAIAGGMANPTGVNSGLANIQKNIDRDVDSQKADIDNGWRGVDAHKGMVAQMFARNNDSYQSAETVRIASYQQAEQQLAAAQQLADPRGKMFADIGQARMGLNAQIAAARAAKQKQDAEDRFKAIAAAQEEEKIVETRRENDLKYEEASWKRKNVGGGGLGGAANTSYTVPVGINDPFTHEPLMGLHEVGGKGKEKEFEQAQADVNSYGEEQLAWQKLAAVAARKDGHRGLAGQVADRLKDTDEKEYEQARGALMAVKLKALGERPNQNSIDAQEALVPKLQEAFGAADTSKIIADSQAANDAQFNSRMNVLGVNASPVIANAQRHRALGTQPSPDADVVDAQQALSQAQSPTDKKDAQARLDAAHDRVKASIEQEQQGKRDIGTASAQLNRIDPLPSDGLPPDFAAEVKQRNLAAQRLDEEHDAFKKLRDSTPTPSKLKGDADKNARDHELDVEKHATRVVQSHNAFAKAEDDLADSLAHAISRENFAGLPRDKVEAVARKFGAEPSKLDDKNAGKWDGDSFAARAQLAAQLRNLSPYRRRVLLRTFFGGD